MVERKEYLQQLLSWKDEQVIKVVTGIRRCGKSTLLQQYQNLLRQQGVAQEQIISINFEDLDYEALLSWVTTGPATRAISVGTRYLNVFFALLPIIRYLVARCLPDAVPPEGPPIEALPPDDPALAVPCLVLWR